MPETGEVHRSGETALEGPGAARWPLLEEDKLKKKFTERGSRTSPVP